MAGAPDEIVFNRPALVDELRRLAAAAPVEPNGFVRGELTTAADALAFILGGDTVGDLLSRVLRLRLLAEVAIRLRWVAGDDDVADDAGRPTVDPVVARERIGRIVKLDLTRLAQAYEAIHRAAGNDWGGGAELRKRAEDIPGARASADPEKLVVGAASGPYTAYRLASAAIHPGLVIGRLQMISETVVGQMADETAYIVVAYGDALTRSLGDT